MEILNACYMVRNNQLKKPKVKGKEPKKSNVVDMMTLLKKSLEEKKKNAA